MEGSDDRSGRPENTHPMAFWNKTRDEAPSPVGPDEATPRLTPSPHEEPHPMAMLKRDDVQTPSSSDLNALLGRGSEFDGKLTFEGTVRIDGKFTGQIHSGDVLVVGEGAKISAEISCGTIIVHGEVNGNIRAKNSVELHHPARVRGNIETPSLMIEKGVLFEGQAKMENLDKAAFPAKPSVAPPPPPPVAAVKP
jgi:cytoskeletal protein CcmA (bactofilin family)